MASALEQVLHDAGFDHQPPDARRQHQEDELMIGMHVTLVARPGASKPRCAARGGALENRTHVVDGR
jgi:hypothetical protein